jgi:hypothetical protein
MSKKKRENVMNAAQFKEFLSRYADDLYKYAGIQFGIYDYELFENTRETGSPVKEYTRAYREVVKEFLDGPADETLLAKYTALRDAVIAKMEVVSAYTDRFTVYEYLMNRAELRFTESEKDIDVSDDEATAQRLVGRIFREQDNNSISLKLKTMLAQLPVRLTTDRFFDIVKKSLELYINSQQSSLKKLDYMIRSASGLFTPDGMDYFADLLEAEKQFEAVKFKEITETEFDELSDTLGNVTTELTGLSEYIGMLENAINQLGILVILDGFVSEEAREAAFSTKELTRWIAENADSKEPVPENLVALFKTGEGRLEELSFGIQKHAADYDAAVSSNVDVIGEQGLSKETDAIEKCQILASDSIYATLDEDESLDVADGTYIEETALKLEKDLKDLFAKKEQKNKRAVMAAVLGELPVFFSSRKAVLDYVTNSLRNCSDEAEKRMSVELLESALDEYESE